MNPLIKKALEQTFNRAIDDSTSSQSLKSFFSAFTGWIYKYKYVEKEVFPADFDNTIYIDTQGQAVLAESVIRVNGRVVSRVIKEGWDLNVYNLIEQLLFPLRLVKNILKLGTESIWYAASEALSAVGDSFIKNDQKSTGLLALSVAASYLFKALALITWIIGKIGQSITSPFAAMKETYKYVAGRTGFKALGYLAASVRGLFSLLAYSAIIIFVAPLFTVPLANLAMNSDLGFNIVFHTITAVNWIGSLPVISTLGTYFATAIAAVAKLVGATIVEGFISAAVIAAATLSSVAALSAVKTILRYISPPWKSKNDLPTPQVSPSIFFKTDAQVNQGLRATDLPRSLSSEVPLLPLPSIRFIANMNPQLQIVEVKASHEEKEGALSEISITATL